MKSMASGGRSLVVTVSIAVGALPPRCLLRLAWCARGRWLVPMMRLQPYYKLLLHHDDVWI